MSSQAHKKFDLTLDRPGLGQWLTAFARHLKAAPGGNPITRMLEADPRCNPYFITSVLYWYRVQSLTLIEKGLQDARSGLALTRTTRMRLERSVAGLRDVAGWKFPPPLGRQLRELRLQRSPASSEIGLKRIASTCERAVNLLQAREEILKEQVNARRKPREAYAMLLWLHMREGLGKSLAGSLLSSLIDSADEAFENPSLPQHWAKFQLTCQRYSKRFPDDYARREREARHNRQRLPPDHIEMWGRLNRSDCETIRQFLQPRFDREVRRIQGIK